jgi:acyl carrier protein
VADLANQESTTELTVDQAIAVIRKQMGRKLPAGHPLDAQTVLEDLGISSLMMTEIFFTIEELVGRELDPDRASGAKTIGELVEVVNAPAATDAD